MSEIEKVKVKLDKCYKENNPDYSFWAGVLTALEWMESDKTTIEEYMESL